MDARSIAKHVALVAALAFLGVFAQGNVDRLSDVRWDLLAPPAGSAMAVGALDLIRLLSISKR